jgi:hypothetical protein
MSNYTKSFNFRNGVQVDDDNFIISPSGLVGIGTTQPTKSLDVFGDTRVSGIASLNNVDIVGILTVGNNITIDATTGIISATSFSGSIAGAGGVVAIATNGFVQNVGALTTDAKVGIKTDNPEFDLQVGSNPESGVGIGVTNGDIFVSGLTTTRNLFVSGVTTFKGGVDGLDLINISGIASLSTLTVSGVTTFSDLIDLNSNLDVSGFSTFTKFVDANDGIDVNGHTELDNVNVSGLSTFNSKLNIASGGLNVSGISTFDNDVTITTGATIDRVQVGVTSQTYVDTSSGDLYLRGDASSNQVVIDAALQVTGVSTFSGDNVDFKTTNFDVSSITGEKMIVADDNDTVKLYFDGSDKIQTIGLGASVYGQLNIASLNGGPSSLSTHFGSLRYGSTAGDAPYSTRRSLDLINTDTGNVNFYVDANNIGVDVGNFYWHRGFDTEQLMTLLNTGSLGIGETQPTEKLHVSGGATFTDNSFFSTNVQIDGNLTVDGSLNADLVGNLTGDVTGNLNGNVNATTGLSTFAGDVIFTGLTTFTSNLAVGNFIGNQPFSVNSFTANRFFVAANGSVGVKTTETFGNDFLVSGSIISNAVVGVGTTIARSVVDFGIAGQNLNGTTYQNRMYMIPPKVTTSQRNLLVGGINAGVGTETGAVIYNTDSNKLQVYTGNGWENLH